MNANVQTPTFQSRTHTELKQIVANAPPPLIPTLIPSRSTVLLVGDSSLGKTPLLVMMGICVAAGLPFLEQPVSQGRVLYVNYENGHAPMAELVDHLLQHLGLQRSPDDFRILSFPETAKSVDEEIQRFKPVLVIVDSLGGYNSQAEKDNTAAGAMLTERERVANRTGTTFLFIHHTRKDDKKNPSPPLIETSVMAWSQEASGARALVNQSNVQIAVDGSPTKDADLIIKWRYKITGESGPWYIRRVFNEEGEPIGYVRLSGTGLLNQKDRDAFAKLPDKFTASEGQKRTGMKGTTFHDFIGRCTGLKLLQKIGKSKATGTYYQKIVSKSSAKQQSEITDTQIQALLSQARPVRSGPTLIER